MSEAVRVAILGTAGYVGGELCRLLVTHPRAELVRAVSKSQAGKRLDSAHRHLRGATDLVFSDASPLDAAEGADVVFLALTHRESQQAVMALRPRLEDPKGPVVIDMSGAFRLLDPAQYASAYAEEHHAPDLLGTFVYAIPELGPAGGLKGARRISSPGCFATAAALAAGPLVTSGKVKGTIVLNGVTGASGSGAQPKDTTHFPMRDGNFKAYRVLSHQHEPEVAQTLDRLAGAGSCLWPVPGERDARTPYVPIVFTTHSGPFTRGIYMTCVAELTSTADAPYVLAEFQQRYAGSRFVRLVDEPAELKGLACTNYADVHLAVRGRQVVVTCAIDNMGKGAAGQGVQAMNLALGLPEDAGLTFAGFTP